MKAVLNRDLAGQRVLEARVMGPLVVRWPTVEEFTNVLDGNRLFETERRGKFLLLRFESGHCLAIHLMLTGHLQLAGTQTPRRKKTSWLLAFDNNRELRYFDQKLDGKVYLVPKAELSTVPRFSEMGPDVLDASLTYEVFAKRIRRFPGQVKRTLVNDIFVAGVGNAYVDEILFTAGIYPFARVRSLREEQIHALYSAIHAVYEWAIPIVAQRMGDTIDEKVRDFLKVHRKGGQPCPNCGTTITQIEPNQRITSYCRVCQNWGQTGGPSAS